MTFLDVGILVLLVGLSVGAIYTGALKWPR